MGEIALKSLFEVSGWDTLAARCDETSIKMIVDEQVKTYHTIDVQDAMRKLSQVGKLLQLAYGGSKGYPCSTHILQVLSRYQDLIKRSSITSTTFVEVVLQALKCHKLALVLADKDKEDKALMMIQKCAALAERMAKETDVLVKASDELCKLSETALMETNKNHNSTEEQKRAVIEAQKKHAEEQVYLEQKLHDLQAAVEEARDEAIKFGRQAEKEESRSAWRLLPINGTDLAEVAEKRGGKMREKEYEAVKKRREFQKDQRNSNAELAKTLMQLQNSVLETDQLGSAIISLDISVKTLGKVKTVFLNTKMFWEGVQNQCQRLTQKGTDVEELLDVDKDLFIEEIKESGYCWLALGKINLQAAKGIRAVDGEVDKILNDLPTKEEAKRLVRVLSEELLTSIEHDNKLIAESIEKCK